MTIGSVILLVLVVGLALIALIVLYAFGLCLWMRGLIARLVFNRRKFCLLNQLYQIGPPGPFDEYEENWDTPFHDHATCTPDICPIKHQEVYDKLLDECFNVGVPKWRIRWVA